MNAYTVKNWMWVFIIAVFLLIAFTGCSTVAGAGKDITGAAEWTKDKMSK